MRRSCGARRRGFTLVEAVLSIAIVGLLLSAAINGVGGVARARATSSERAIAASLAERLTDEILLLPYLNPGLASGPIGPSAGEAATGNRSLFNDVDDYNGWTESPPQEKDGTKMTGLTGWTRSVKVEWVNPNDVTQTSVTDLRIKRITVTVSHLGRIVSKLVTLRPRAFDAAVLAAPAASTADVTHQTASTVGAGK